MIQALFLGSSEHLKLAFPPPLRERLGKSVKILSGDKDASPPLSEADVLFATWGMPRMDEEFLAEASRLRAVFYAAGSVKSFATEAAFARGIQVFSGWGANAIPVCEYTVSVIRLSLKRFWSYMLATRESKTFEHSLPVAGGYGAKVGIVSLGAIGRLVLRELAKKDLQILAYDPLLAPQEIQSMGADPCSLEEIFANCNVVSLHIPWLPQTEKLINERLLSLLPEGATLINTARGAVIDEMALCRTLAARPDLTAVLDVTYPEPPPPDSPLYTLRNVVLTPHIAGSMGREVERMGLWMVEDFERWIQGQPTLHAVPPEKLSQMA